METSATTIVVPPTAEEQRIASIADSINLADPSLTVTYGTEAMQGISRFADDLLSRVQAKDSGELGESLTNLMLKVKDVNVSEVMGSPGFLQSLPLVGSLFSSAKRTVAKFNTLSEQIEIIVDKLDEAMIGLLRDIETLEMLYEHNARFHAELTAYIEAGKRKLEEARTVELPRLKAQADASGDLMEAQQVRDLSEQINRFERRLHDLQLSRTITVQTAPQIRIIQSNNRTLAEKIQTSILATIPIWKSQMVLALSLHGQKNAAALQKTVSDTTNDMLRSNAELLEQAAVDTAREVERSVVDIETLREVHEKLIGTIEETLRIAQEGRERRAAAEKELAVMETELKDRLTSLAARKSREEIAAASGTETRQSAARTGRHRLRGVIHARRRKGTYGGRTERRGTEGFVLGCDTSVLQAYPLSYQRVHHWGDSVYPCSANTSGRGRSWRLPWPYLHRRARRIPETVVARPRRVRRGAGRLADPFRYAVPVCAVLGRLAVMGTAPSGEILSHGHGMGSVFSVAHHGLLSEANPFPASCHAVLRPPRRGTGHPLGLGPQACGGTGTQAQTGTEARTSPLPG